MQGKGLSQTQALALANKFVPQLVLQAPTYVPKQFMLQFIQIDPAQGTGSPSDGYLQYVPKGLTTAGGTYPSFYITKQLGLLPIILPGAKVQHVVINKGVKGAGVITGTVVDFKPKNGSEVVHIVWTRLTVTYDVSSSIGVSKLGINDLLAVAATVQ